MNVMSIDSITHKFVVTKKLFFPESLCNIL